MAAPTEISRIYPLTPMQEGMLFHSLYEQQSQAYFEQLTLTLEGEVVPELLEQSFNLLIERYDIFRTVFIWEKVQKPRQIVLKQRKAGIIYKDISLLPEERQEALVRKEMEEDRQLGFDVSKDLLIRITLFQTGQQTFKMIWSNHHLLIDGWCTMPLIHELLQIYHALQNQLPLNLKRIYPYSDYIEWLEKQDKEEALEYWKHYISGYSELALIPHQKRLKPGACDYVLEEQIVEIDAEVTQRLVEVAKQNQVTLNIVFQAIWGVLLQRYNHTDDVIFGSVISGRPPEIEGVEHIIGLFINTIPVRVQSRNTLTYTKLIKELQQASLASEKYGYASLAEIQAQSGVKQELFQHILAFQNFNTAGDKQEAGAAGGVRITESEAFEQTNYNFTVMLAPGERMLVKFSYNEALYDREFIEAMGAHVVKLMQQVAAKPDIQLIDLDIVTDLEQEHLLFDFNRTSAPYPVTKTVIELFEEMASQQPDQIAVVSNQGNLSYQQLNERANRLGAELQRRNVKPNTIVAIIADRSLHMIAGVMGILKAGGAYLPIDPEYPTERIAYMLQDSGARLLLHESHLGTDLVFEGEKLSLDDEKWYQTPSGCSFSGAKPGDLAYVIYTSGSTGTPKGVMVTHQSLVNLCFWHKRKFKITPDDQTVKFAGFGFDASVWETFPYLTAGATLHMIPDEIRLDLVQLNRYFEQNQITICFLPTQFCEQFIALDNRSLRILLTGGEQLNHYMPTPYTIVNNYGPTENTVVTTSFSLEHPMHNIPIGKPIDNTRVYVLNPHYKLQPVGIPGELYVSGDGLAKGYLNRPDLTDAAFIPNPYHAGERMYKTGDLVKWRSDGHLEYLGRTDQQVKIRGYRIETGEIVHKLLQYSSIRDAIVVPKQDTARDLYLCAYLLTADGWVHNSLEIKSYLGKTLPDYMIPAAFVYLNEFPMTANGKIDYRALPEPSADPLSRGKYAAPANYMEQQLARTWQEVLGDKEFGRMDNFFEQGGHSLKAVALSARIQKQLERNLPVRIIFEHPTIKEMAEYLLVSEKSVYSALASVEEREWYPASSQQKRVYVVSQLDAASKNYNMPGMTLIKGELDTERFNKAFQAVIGRHESLRSSFEMIDGELIQRIHPQLNIPIDFDEAKGTQLESRIAHFIQPFDFGRVPLFRASLIKLGSEEHLLMLDMHHIISDGASMSIFMKEWMELYNGKLLGPLKLQYKDYAVWQQEQIHEGAMQQQKTYWLHAFSGELPVLELPTDYPRPVKQTFAGDIVSLHLDQGLSEKVLALATSNGSTVFMTLLAVYNVLLAKYSGQEDIIVGTPVANRSHPDLERVMGMFANTLPLRHFPQGNKSFQQFLLEVKENVLRAYEHQDYPFEELVDQLQLDRNAGRNSLFDTMFTMQNLEPSSTAFDELELLPYSMDYKIAKFDLTLQVTQDHDALYFEWEYSTDLFAKETVQRIARHLNYLVEQITAHPGKQLKELKLVSEAEEAHMIALFNATQVAYPREKTVVELFEEQAEKLGSQTAVVYGDERLTYGELNARANQLARILRSKGVCGDSLVALRVERSIEMVIGMIGILKAGGAYVPIDPEAPAERALYMLADSGASIMLTQRSLMGSLAYDGEVLDLQNPELYQGEAGNLELRHRPHHLVYVIYTSGSTGQPKGVMVEHAGLSNILYALHREYPLLENDRYLLKTNYTFDVSASELFGWIPGGGALVILAPGEEKDPGAILKAIEEHRITHLNFVPSMLKVFVMTAQNLERMSGLKYLFIAGEALPRTLVQELRQKLPGVRLENIYGPTEGTIYATKHALGDETGSVPIGKPLDNIRAYILNREGQLQPAGIPGELCIAGAGLARGYLNRRELTAEKFTANPYEPGERMYRTGDLARWLADGTIEYEGRIDFQVKIKGYRIELGEITARLQEHEKVKDAAVVARQDEQGQPYLCAYIVARTSWSKSEMRQYASRYLPHYMVPSFFVELAELPLNASGKIDSRRLPEPDRDQATEAAYVAPGNEMEMVLAGIWQAVLGIKQVGVEDNFFELGGHSLKATVLVSRIEKEFQVRFSLRDVFQYPTVRDMAAFIASQSSITQTHIEQAPASESYPVSSAQKRLYMIHQIDSSSINYNMPIILEVNGKLDLELFRSVIQQLAERHGSLRTSFAMLNDELRQSVHDHIQVPVEWASIAEEELLNRIQMFIRPFDLNQAPLFRAGVLHLAANRHILLMDVHHIIADGISMGIFMNEFSRLYAGETLPPIKLEYKDFVHWQHNFRESGEMSRQEAYWLKLCRDPLPVLQLPADDERPPIQRFEGDSITFELDEEFSGKVMELAKAYKATPFMLLLAVYKVLLAKYSGQEDIVVGTTLSGRTHTDVEPIIGMFVNTVILRSYPKGGKTFEELLLEVKEHVLEVFNNQSVAFDVLVEKLDVRRDMSRNPLFDAMFVFQNVEENEWAVGDTTFSAFKHAYKIAKFDLNLQATERKGQLAFEWEYSTHLFRRETIETFAGHFIYILGQILQDPRLKLSQITTVTPEEKQRMLYGPQDAVCYSSQTIHGRFEEQARITPEQPALVMEGCFLTYRELNERANQLARVLRNKGVVSETIVALMTERSLEMIVSMLAVLKAGGAYLPIDPSYPLDRIAYTLENSEVRYLITDTGSAVLQHYRGTILELHDETLFSGETDNLTITTKPDQLAYVLYTSGTTGRPKGVMIEHRNVVSLLTSDPFQFDFHNQDVWTMFHSYCFDFSVWEMYGALLYGGKLVLVPKTTAQSPEAFIKLLQREKVTVLNITPTAYYALLEAEAKEPAELPLLRYVIFGGEALKPRALIRWHHKYPDLNFVNMYGITETTVHVTFKKITYEDMKRNKSNIGQPIPTLKTYIFDERQQLVSTGIVGEMYVGGAGVARGYLFNPQLTAERFIVNPYNTKERLYRTGDLARILPGGDMEYYGRIDHQVKIRGFRIELGEIENQLVRHEMITQAVVIDNMDEQGNKYLCAYFVSSEVLTVTKLREFLIQVLPDYMIPAFFIRMDQIPMTTNGKVDRSALPERDQSLLSPVHFASPGTETEHRLAEIWQDVLGIGRIGIHDNFYELGGDSIKAVQIAARLNKHQLKLEVKHLFQYPTIADVSGFVKPLEAAVSQEPVTGEAVLGPIQSWFFDQNFSHCHHWNQAMMITRRQGFDPEHLKNVFHKLVEHHDALRLVFRLEEDGIVQSHRGVEDQPFSFEMVQLEEEVNLAERIHTEASRMQAAFNLHDGPLLHLGLFKTGEEDHLLIIIHHLIVDGVSWRIIFEDLTIGYQQSLARQDIVFQAKTNSYKQWTSKLAEYGRSKKLHKELPYWEKVESADVSVLPKDFPAASNRWDSCSVVSCKLNLEETEALLKRVHKAYHTEINDLLLTALGYAVKDWSGADNVLIELEGHGREELFQDMNISRTVGWFTSVYPIILNMEHSKDISSQIKTVKEMLRNVPDKGIGYRILQYLTPLEQRGQLEFKRNPEISFNYLGQFDRDMETDVFAPSAMPSGTSFNPESERTCVLDVTGMVENGELKLQIMYNHQQYKQQTMATLAESYKRHLLHLVEHCLDKEQTDVTPSDFSATNLSMSDLENVFAALGQKLT